MLPARQPARPDPGALEALYHDGRYRAAWNAIAAAGEPERWGDAAAIAFASRLARNLGGERRASSLAWRAWRTDRTDPAAQEAMLRLSWRHHGPLAAWRRLEALPAPAAPAHRASHLCLRAELLIAVRRFTEAEALIAEAEALDDHPWHDAVRVHLALGRDQPAQALEAVEAALEKRGHYRPMVQNLGEVLVRLDRIDEAIARLRAAQAGMESCWVSWQLAHLELEHGDHAGCARSLDRFAAEAVLLEDDLGRTLAARRAELAYRAGDRAGAAIAAAGADETFRAAMAAAAEAPSERRELAVPRILQRHMTCAPASLAIVVRWHGMEADQDAIAAEICHGGTPAFRERAWCAGRGLAVREFTVTWDAVRALIDRGLPFTLTTVESTSSHLQVVVGYDAALRRVLIRDPGTWFRREVEWEWIERRYRAFGPRGMVAAPAERAAEIAGLALTDAALHDALHRLHLALECHRRAEAGTALAELEGLDADHRLARDGRLALAWYDGDAGARAEATGAALAADPGDDRRLLAHVSALREAGREAERLALFEREAGPTADPALLAQFAQALRADARRRREAIGLAERAVRRLPADHVAYAILGHLLADAGDPRQAAFCFRSATALQPSDEGCARAAFDGELVLGRREEALAALAVRAEAEGAGDAEPTLTLAWALGRCGRAEAAIAAIAAGCARRPRDAQLRLALAERRAWIGDAAAAAADLAAAEPWAGRAAWLRTAAEVADLAGDRGTAIARWREALALDPLAVATHTRLARALAEAEGPAAAIAHLRAAHAAQPHHYGLASALVGWLREEHADEAAVVAAGQVERRPHDAWWRRELGWLELRRGHREAAARLADEARALAPDEVGSWNLLGDVAAADGRASDATDCFRAAIAIAVDSDYAIDRLLALADGPTAHRAELALVRREMQRQVLSGDALRAYRARAHAALPAEEVLDHLREAHAARPDLWQAWEALAEELREAGRSEEALAHSAAFVGRFPLLARAWTERALACALAGDGAGRQSALERAVELAPWWGYAARELAQARHAAGDGARRIRALERAIAFDPLDAYNHGWLAEALHDAGRTGDALAPLERAVLLHPGYAWGWEALARWQRDLGRPEAALAAARAATARRPRDPLAWLGVVRVSLEAAVGIEEARAAADRALELDPRLVEAHLLRIRLLVAAGDHAGAIAACRPPGFPAGPPIALRVERAELLAGDDLAAGIAEVQAIAADDPRCATAWRHLADWRRRSGDHDGAIEAAERLALEAPIQALSWSCLGQAREAAERNDAAAAYARALDLDPTYAWAARRLAVTALAARDLPLATRGVEALERLGARDAPAHRCALAAQAGDRRPAFAAFRALCAAPDADPDDVQWAHRTLSDRGWGAQAEDVLAVAVAATPGYATAWLWARNARGWWASRRVARRMRTLPDQAWRGAAAGWLDNLGERERGRAAAAFTRRHRERLRADTFLWGKAGYALVAGEANRAAATWMADWRERADAQPWMLHNAALAWRMVGSDAAADAVSAHLANLPPHDFTTSHRRWNALALALAGDGTAAQERLDAIERPTEGDDLETRLLHDLALAACHLATAGPEQRREAALAALGRVLVCRSRLAGLSWPRPQRGALRGVLRGIARDGGWGARMWVLMMWPLR